MLKMQDCCCFFRQAGQAEGPRSHSRFEQVVSEHMQAGAEASANLTGALDNLVMKSDSSSNNCFETI